VIAYRFDVSTSPTFTPVTVTGTVPEGPVQTTFTPASPLTLNATYYWRATAIDQTKVIAGGPSAVWSFTASSLQGLMATPRWGPTGPSWSSRTMWATSS
jgi:hypothetical protein